MKIELTSQNPGATDIELEKFEERHSIRLPLEYRQFLTQHNGAIPIENTFTFTAILAEPKEIESGVQKFFSLGEIDYTISNLSEFVPSHLVPICELFAYDILLIDVSKNSYGRILYWDQGMMTTPRPGEKYDLSNAFEVAKSFNGFLRRLEPGEPYAED